MTNTTDTSAISLTPITINLSLSFGTGDCRSHDELLNEDEHTLEQAIEQAQWNILAEIREKANDWAWMFDFDVHVQQNGATSALILAGYESSDPFTQSDAVLWGKFAQIARISTEILRSYEYNEPIILQAVADIHHEQSEADREQGYRG